MAIDWEALARDIGGLEPDGRERIVGTSGGQRALELLIGEENLRDSVDYWVAQKPGCFTAEMVLAILKSKAAMERCYEIFKSAPDSEARNAAVFLLGAICNEQALPWVGEFLADKDPIIPLNGLAVLSRILYGPLSDRDYETAASLVELAEAHHHEETRKRAERLRSQLQKNSR